MDERSGEPPTRRLVLLAAVGLGLAPLSSIGKHWLVNKV